MEHYRYYDPISNIRYAVPKSLFAPPPTWIMGRENRPWTRGLATLSHDRWIVLSRIGTRINQVSECFYFRHCNQKIDNHVEASCNVLLTRIIIIN